MGRILIIFVLIFLIGPVSGCIDINSASVDELDELTGIGPVYAGRIIDGRPFDSLDDLVKVSGIGEITLEKIKTQGLACIEEKIKEIEKVEESEKGVKKDLEIIEINEIVSEIESPEPDKKIIKLNHHEEKNSVVIYESKNEKIRKYSIYGFSLFLVFIIAVLICKQ